MTCYIQVSALRLNRSRFPYHLLTTSPWVQNVCQQQQRQLSRRRSRRWSYGRNLCQRRTCPAVGRAAYPTWVWRVAVPPWGGGNPLPNSVTAVEGAWASARWGTAILPTRTWTEVPESSKTTTTTTTTAAAARCLSCTVQCKEQLHTARSLTLVDLLLVSCCIYLKLLVEKIASAQKSFEQIFLLLEMLKITHDLYSPSAVWGQTSSELVFFTVCTCCKIYKCWSDVSSHDPSQTSFVIQFGALMISSDLPNCSFFSFETQIVLSRSDDDGDSMAKKE